MPRSKTRFAPMSGAFIMVLFSADTPAPLRASGETQSSESSRPARRPPRRDVAGGPVAGADAAAPTSLAPARIRALLAALKEPERREAATEELTARYDRVLEALFSDDARLKELGADLEDPEVSRRVAVVRRFGPAAILDRQLSARCRAKLPALAREAVLQPGAALARTLERRLEPCLGTDALLLLETVLRRASKEEDPGLPFAAVTIIRDARILRRTDLLAKFAGAADALLRAAALSALGSFGSPAREFAPAVEAALGDKDWRVRSAAAEALARVRPDPRTAGLLAALLKDARAEVRSAAEAALRLVPR